MARVLVVDDSKVILSVVQTYLMALDVDFEVAVTAEDGLARFKARPADVVLVDYRLAAMDGITLIERFRQLARGELRAVLISSSQDVRVDRALQDGTVDAFLPKPLDGDTLKKQVATQLLDLSRSQPARLSLVPTGRRRVVLAEDTEVGRRLISRLLATEPVFEHAATAEDARSLLDVVRHERPDLVLIDALIPGMNIADVTRRIMEDSPSRVVVLTEHFSSNGTRAGFEALLMGALDVVARPSWDDLEGATGRRFVSELLTLSGLQLPRTGVGSVLRVPPSLGSSAPRASVVALVGSVGGPVALATLLPVIEPHIAATPVLIGQALAPGLTSVLAEWLADRLNRRVSIAFDGMTLEPGSLVLAPDDHHVVFSGPKRLAFTDQPENEPMPGPNPLLRTMGQHHGAEGLAVILSAAGTLGIDGARSMAAAGGLIIVQSPGDCLADDLPQAVMQANLAAACLPRRELGEEIARRM